MSERRGPECLGSPSATAFTGVEPVSSDTSNVEARSVPVLGRRVSLRLNRRNILIQHEHRISTRVVLVHHVDDDTP
jgi:hypothetical protein